MECVSQQCRRWKSKQRCCGTEGNERRFIVLRPLWSTSADWLLKLTAFCWNEPKQPLSWWEGHLTPVSSDCSNSIEVNLPQEFQFWVDCDFKIKAEHIKFPPSLGFCPIKASCFIKSTLYVLWHKHTHCTVTVPNAAAWSKCLCAEAS